MASEYKFKYKVKITDDIADAHEIIRNVGRTIQEGKTDVPSALHNLAEALKKLESAKYYIDRE
jgi:septation ring formation regulator EzrA